MANSTPPSKIAQVRELAAQGLDKSAIARELGLSRPTVHKILQKGVVPAADTGNLDANLPERAKAARERLWAILQGPDSTGAEVVSAFRELRESEGWTEPDSAKLPEPANDQEAAELAIELMSALPKAVQDKIKERLGLC